MKFGASKGIRKATLFYSVALLSVGGVFLPDDSERVHGSQHHPVTWNSLIFFDPLHMNLRHNKKADAAKVFFA